MIFTERLPGLVARYAPRTIRLTEALHLLGAALGGEAGARVSVPLGLGGSPDLLLRLLRQVSDPRRETPRLLGVDDFAFRRGQRYGTLLVDLERRRPVDLLPDRQAITLATWLQAHPGVELVTRDRSLEYAKGITEGAPHALQIADRFHLLTNLREMVERVVERHRQRLQGIVLPRPSWDVGTPPREDTSVARPRQPAKRSSSERAMRQARYEHRLWLRQQVHALLREAGEHILGIARQLDLNRSTVYRYLRHLPEVGAVRTRHIASRLDPYLPHLGQRWAEGCRNSSQRWRELREQGYRGARKMVTVRVQHQREEPAPTTPKKYSLPSESAPAPPGAGENAAPGRLPSTRQTS